MTGATSGLSLAVHCRPPYFGSETALGLDNALVTLVRKIEDLVPEGCGEDNAMAPEDDVPDTGQLVTDASVWGGGGGPIRGTYGLCDR